MPDIDPKESLLLVDDTPANLEILIRLFQKEGYKVRAVTNGPMALRAAENDLPDLILLDVSMPEMDGYEVCRKLKESESLNKIPVIFISALSEVFDKVTAFEAGGVDYITKPIHFEEALARVRTHLALRKYQRLIEEKNLELHRALEQLKEAQGQLINSEKLASLGVLTAGIAHEINNPISFIYSSSLGLEKNIHFFLDIQKRYEAIIKRSNVDMIKELEEYKSENDFDERMTELTALSENIITGSRRISGIVRSLRLFARLDENDLKEIDLHENIDSTLVLLHHKLSNKISIVKRYGDIPPVPCFPARISQVFMNILSNAIEAMEATGENQGTGEIIISTGLCSQGELNCVKVDFRDTGPGIPEDLLEKVLDPFFTTKPVGKGMGLGLSISNNIIREHGGKIKVFNNTPNGAVFQLFLPLKNRI